MKQIQKCAILRCSLNFLTKGVSMYKVSKTVLDLYEVAQQAFLDKQFIGEDAYFDAENAFVEALEAEIEQTFPGLTQQQYNAKFDAVFEELLETA